MTESSATRPSLGLTHGVALYVGAVLGTGVLVLPAVAAETAGPASILAWLVLVALSAPMALTYAALSRQKLDVAGFAGAIERAFGPRWGGVAGWLFLAQTPTGYVVAALIAGEYGASIFGGGRELVFVLGGGLVLLAFMLNLAGLRVSSAVQVLAIAVIAAGMCFIVGRSLFQVDRTAFTPFFSHGYTAVGLAAVQLFWAFVGWEAITPLAPEFRDARDIWLASVLAVAIVGVLYISLAIATIGTHAYGPTLGGEVPLVRMTSATFGSLAALVVGSAGVALSFPVINAYTAGITRLAYALASRQQLPVWLAVMTPKGTPRRALAVLGVLVSGATAVAYLARLQIADLLPLSTSSFIATYVLSMAAGVRLLRPPLAYVAAVALAACTLVLLFTGFLLGWIAIVALCSLVYQQAHNKARSRSQ
jgi:amino acid efflux transporter